MTCLPPPVADESGHLLHQMGFRDIRDDDECVILEIDNRPDLTNIRGALQGGLVASVVAVDVLDRGADRLAVRATLSFAVLDPR